MSELTDFGPNRMLEIIRRLCLLVGVLATALAIVKPTDALFRVRDVNFAKRQKQEGARMRQDIKMMSRVSGMELDPNDPQINTAPTLTLEQYIEKKTKNSLIEVSGGQWTQFFNDVDQTLAGKTTTFARHLDVDRHSSLYMLYFNTDYGPLKELQSKLDDKNVFTYVAMRDGDKLRYIEVLYQRPQSAYHDAPNWLLYPLRKNAVWCFILGLLVYAAIPWYRKAADELRYSTARAMVVPDIVGAIMTVFFFALPILVITTNARSSEPVDIFGFTNGWWPLTAVMWLLACGGLATLFVSLWYACYTLKITATGFRRSRLPGADDYAFADMMSIGPAKWAWPWWLRILVILISLARPRLTGAVILGAFEEAYGIAIRMKDGRTLKIWMTHLPGFARIFHALRKANVPMDAELAKTIDEDLANAEPESKPGKGGKIAAGILMTLAILGALTWQYWPTKTRVVKHELQFTYEQLAQRMALTQQMMKIAEQMKEALALPADATPQQRAAAMKKFEELQKQHDELDKRYEAIKPTEED
jgi:hypothetical protein